MEADPCAHVRAAGGLGKVEWWVSTTRERGRWGWWPVAVGPGRCVKVVAGRCGPRGSGRWCWWTSRRSADRYGSVGGNAAGYVRMSRVVLGRLWNKTLRLLGTGVVDLSGREVGDHRGRSAGTDDPRCCRGVGLWVAYGQLGGRTLGGSTARSGQGSVRSGGGCGGGRDVVPATGTVAYQAVVHACCRCRRPTVVRHSRW